MEKSYAQSIRKGIVYTTCLIGISLIFLAIHIPFYPSREVWKEWVNIGMIVISTFLYVILLVQLKKIVIEYGVLTKYITGYIILSLLKLIFEIYGVLYVFDTISTILVPNNMLIMLFFLITLAYNI